MKDVSEKTTKKAAVLIKKPKLDGFKHEPVYDENPFIVDTIGELKVKRKQQFVKPLNNKDYKGAEVMMVTSDGEVQGHTAFVRHLEVDSDKFTKLYINQLACLWDLNKTAMRVFTYILNVLKPLQDHVIFDNNDCMVFCGYKNPASIYEGLYCLLQSGIIAKSNKSYKIFINPSVVFNGDRVTFINTYTKKKKIEADPNQTSLLNLPDVGFDLK